MDNNVCNHENCESCLAMQNKINKYEEILKDLFNNNNNNNNNTNYELIKERDIHGVTTTKVITDIGESIYVVETGKDLRELSKVELDSIKSQDSLRNYEKTVKICKKTSTAWDICSTVVSVTRIVGNLFI